MPDPNEQPAADEIELGPVLAALADSRRRQVVADLAREPDGVERTCVSFGLPVSASTLTHHFRVLREAGLIRQIDYGNANKVMLRRADIEQRFPGLLDIIRSGD
jgi:DNA-binding transcriptional ArsR family regulator